MNRLCPVRICSVSFGAVISLLTAALIGCQTNGDRTYGTAVQPVEFDVQSSSKEIMAGEIVTLTTESENLHAQDVRIEWSSTGGDIEAEDNGRIARVRFDSPGTYTVFAELFVDDRLVETEWVDVRVNPVRSPLR